MNLTERKAGHHNIIRGNTGCKFPKIDTMWGVDAIHNYFLHYLLWDAKTGDRGLALWFLTSIKLRDRLSLTIIIPQLLSAID